jgi:hypothetical protein
MVRLLAMPTATTSRLNVIGALLLASFLPFLAEQGKAQVVDTASEIRQAATFSLFVSRHERLLGAGGASASLYGIRGAELEKLTQLLHSAKSEIDQLQSTAPTYASQNRGTEYYARRRALMTSAKATLQAQLSAASWDRINTYLDQVLGPKLAMAKPAGNKAASRSEKSLADYPDVWLIYYAEVYFYQGGLAGEVDSYPEGPDAIDYCSYVSGVVGRKEGNVFAGPWDSEACYGGLAWAWWVLPSPLRGTYSVEGYHSYYNTWTMTASPPFSYFVPPTPPPPPAVWTMNQYTGFDFYETPIDFWLDVPATAEANKEGHYLALKNCTNPIDMTAQFNPGIVWWSSAPTITWTGGTPISGGLQRRVQCTNPGDTAVTASIGANLSATATVHVVDAEPPNATGLGVFWWNNLGPPTLPPNAFGRVVVGIGLDGVTAPTFEVAPGLSGNRWVFRLDSISHGFKMATQSLLREDLPNGNARPFPISALLPSGTSVVAAHTAARADLDTTAMVPQGSIIFGPRRSFYWVESITQEHEQFHVDDFYNTPNLYWQAEMHDFEASDIEASSVSVVYDCADPTTTTGSAAIAKLRPTWDNAIAAEHAFAIQLHSLGAEDRAHRYSNPKYVPIWNAIPTGGSPLVASLSRTSAAPGSVEYLVILGQNLDANPQMGITGTGISLTITYIGSTQINLYYQVDPGAPLGPRTITVDTDNGPSNGETFTVVTGPPPPPSIGGIYPATGSRGTSGWVGIYGENLAFSEPTVSVSGTGVTVWNMYVSPVQVNVGWTIDSDAEPGERTLTLTTASGTSNGVTFTVE